LTCRITISITITLFLNLYLSNRVLSQLNPASRLDSTAKRISFSLSLDTVPKLLLRPFQQVKDNVATGIRAQQQKISQLLNVKKLLPQPLNVPKNPFVLHQADAAYNRIDNNANIAGAGLSYYGDWELNSNWSIATIPFDIQINNQTWTDLSRNNFTNLGAHFNKEQYLQQLKKKLKDKFKPEEFINTDLRNQVEAIKTNAGSLLEKDLKNINQAFGSALNEQIGQLGDVKGMFTKDIASVRQQLLTNEFIQSVTDKEKLLSELQNRKNTGQAVNDTDLKQLEQEVAKLKGVNTLLQKVEEHKNKWQSSGLLTKMKKMELLERKQVEKIIKDPGTTIKLAKQHLQLNGLQKLFLKLNSLNIGQNTLSASPLTVQHMLNKGINTEFFDKNKLLSLGVGKLKTFNSILDQPFTNSMLSNDGMAKMIQFGIGSPSASHSHVSLMTYNQTLGSSNSFSDFGNFSNLNSFRTTVVTTISNQLLIGERGMITTELSRSATTYQQMETSDSTLSNKSAMQRILGGDNLFNNMAIAVKYEDEIADKELSYGLRANFTAPGYINPGSTFLNAGGKEFGVNVKKFFWKGKLQAAVRSDVREFDYSDEGDRLWRNFYSVMDLRYKLRKGQYIGIRYMPNKMTRIENGTKSVVTQLDRFSIDGAIAQKIAGLYYRNNFSLAFQKNKYVLDYEPISNTTVTVSGFQNITIGGKLYYLNTQYDYANNNSQYVYFNSSFLTEAGVTYLLLKRISLSSALSYNSVQGWYRQIGVRQTVAGQLTDRFNLNIYVDARKNIELLQPLLFGLFRTDISIHYQISK
jgi:hypothetical protein